MYKLILLLAVAAVVVGQPMAPGGRQQNMDAVRIWKLTESLELTEDQITTFIPVVQLHEREMRNVQREMMTQVRKLNAQLEQGAVSEKEATRTLEQFIKMQEKMDAIRIEFIRSLPKYLTPRQQLQYLGFEVEFRRNLRKFLQEQRRGGDFPSRRP